MVSYGPIATGSRKWTHTSADTGATVDTTGFITDGGNRGMKVGDLVEHTNTGTNIVTLHRVMAVSATAPGAVDLSDTTTIASGTNSD
jgi:hypothetical protein